MLAVQIELGEAAEISGFRPVTIRLFFTSPMYDVHRI